MGHEEPRQTREGRLIEEATKASGRSIRSLAANIGISDTRWRQIMKGSQPGPGGVHVQVTPPAVTLAKMATVLGLDPADVERTGRGDAADIMRKVDFAVMVERDRQRLTARHEARSNGPDEIDLIYASTTMSARQKLELIRRVLELRAQVEAEEPKQTEQQTAPAPEGVGAVVQR